jgi:hypothetical protein
LHNSGDGETYSSPFLHCLDFLAAFCSSYPGLLFHQVHKVVHPLLNLFGVFLEFPISGLILVAISRGKLLIFFVPAPLTLLVLFPSLFSENLPLSLPLPVEKL